jgi:acetamidase/formamidase
MANIGALSICSLLLSALALPNALAAEYTLMPSPQTVHVGHFSAALKPVLTINSGDTVIIETVSGPDPEEVDASGVVPPSAVPEYVRTIRRDVTDRGPGGHILTGPVYVSGAMPGDVLELRILEVDFAVPYGFNAQRPYTGALPDEFPGFFRRVIPIDRQAKTATVAPGVVVPVPRPFFGVMGVAPLPVMGRISSAPPGVHTGNLDNRDLSAGTTLFMPVYTPGALFSVGDAHAAQGQGEVDLTGHRNRATRQVPVHRAQRHEDHVAARRNVHPLDRDGPQPEPRGGDEDGSARDHPFHHPTIPQAFA